MLLLLFIIIIKTLFTLGLERKIYRNEMITAKDKKVTHASHWPHASRPDYGIHPARKMRKPRGENAANLLIFYCGFKIILTDQVQANNHKYKYTKSKQLNIQKA